MKNLLQTGILENYQLAKQIASNHLAPMKTVSSEDLLMRIERVLGYLIYEHRELQQKYRYTSDKQAIEKDSLLVKVVDELEERIMKGKINRDGFLRLIFLGSEGHRREVLFFRLFRHFNPNVVHFIQQTFLSEDASPVDIWRIAYSYAIENHEQDMRIVYSNFLHSIINKIAKDGILKDPLIINRGSLRNVVRSIGSLLTSS